MIDETEKISRQIQKLHNKIVELHNKRQKICQHDVIEMTSYVDDDYAQSWARKYITTYLCKRCSLYGSSENKNDIYNMLENKYKIALKNKYKMKDKE